MPTPLKLGINLVSLYGAGAHSFVRKFTSVPHGIQHKVIDVDGFEVDVSFKRLFLFCCLLSC